ncbi:hypothetical protein IPA_06715 [Ignicoccus pacificus DSM 13166]|uniref:Uncharacterized protein n=1 Tax=Ignicoccus pacificus DSM 13166 TaxID=940294 RepID=A0A977KBG3_9CREN|nr:hypothetical protein IPA_06715 [Ignicoccus pacificus DSM 13166]
MPLQALWLIFCKLDRHCTQSTREKGIVVFLRELRVKIEGKKVNVSVPIGNKVVDRTYNFRNFCKKA